jgi:hypothetical protein
MRTGVVALVLPLVLGVGACGKEPMAPTAAAAEGALLQRGHFRGTGFVLESITGATLPLGLDLGDAVIRQAMIKEFGIAEDIAGSIVGLNAVVELRVIGEGPLSTGVTEEFTTGVGIISSGRGCRVIGVDLAPLAVDVLGRAVVVDVPVATVEAGSSGAVGSLLCAAGKLLTPVTGGAARALRSLVDAVNRLLI